MFTNKEMVDYIKEYNNYLNEYYKIPRHVKTKLKNMPNNKGFICNGIYLYGHQKSTSNKINILFEKIYPYIYIHEITQRNYKIIRMDINTKEKLFICNNQRKIKHIV
jgi:hypothetical protein